MYADTLAKLHALLGASASSASQHNPALYSPLETIHNTESI